MNINELVNEFREGVKTFYNGQLLLTEIDDIEFFVFKAHQIAFDDGLEEEFKEAFPNFFEYRKNVDQFKVLAAQPT